MKNEGAIPARVCARHLSKVYGKTDYQVTACRDIDFSAEPGSITALLGLNGAGKSTLLKILCGIQYASEGSISVCGETDIASIRRLCEYVPEVSELDFSLTVKETLFREAFLRNCPKAEIRAQIHSAAAALDLEAVLGKTVGTLSKGYRQRVSLAKALAANTDVLVLDEFSAGLDPAQIVKVRDLMKELAKQKTIILSTHHIEEALTLCAEIYILHKGTVVAHGSPEGLLASAKKQNLEEAFLWFTRAQ